jgi:hypothetical protein
MPIEESTLIQAIMSTRSQIDVIWQVFVTVHIALFALLFIYDEAVESMNALARVLSIAGMGLFEWINGSALYNTYALLEAFHVQYRADFGQASRFQPLLFERFVQATFDGRDIMLMLTHGTAFLVIVMAFMWRRFIQQKRAKRSLAER